MGKFIAVIAALMLALVACDEAGTTDALDNDAAAPAEEVNDFDTLDANGDSYLDADEVAEWADDTGVFTDWDEDADSELDEDELFGNTFSLYDADGNGTISESEWETAADTVFPNDKDLIVFDDFDSDGDSEIDEDEFAERFDFSYIGESWVSDPLDEETFRQSYFELYDADNDGRVSEDEFRDGAALVGTADEL